jgi:CHAT domain-containing protein
MYESAVDLLMSLGRETQAFEIADRSRARSLLDLLFDGRDHIRSGVAPGLQARNRDLEQQVNMRAQQLNSIARLPADAARMFALQKEIEGLLAERELVQDQIERENPRYADLWRPRPASLAEIQGKLDDETALLEFALGTQQSFLWVIKHASFQTVKLPGRTVIERDARIVTQLAGNLAKRVADRAAEQRFQRALAALRRELFGGVRSEISVRKWLIVPDGLLHYVPLSALYPDRQMTELPSASMLPVLRRAIAARKDAPLPLIVFADAVFDLQDPRNSHPATAPERPHSGLGFGRLRFSAAEARAIARQVPNAVLATGFDARKQLLMSPEIAKYRILHLSTHAMIDDAVPALSLIALSQVNKQAKEEDGVLRLYETFNLNLPATDLVVLSACQTGLGKQTRGEGILGFARGFFYSGATSVLVSLWAVDEEATEQMMPRFYEAHLRRHMSTAAALVEAQRFIRSQTRWSDPYYWAGFSVIGGE